MINFYTIKSQQVMKMPRKKESGLESLSRIFVILGAILIILYGIFHIFGIGILTMLKFKGFGLEAIISGVILIVIGIGILSSYGLLKTSLEFGQNWLVNLVLGVITFLLGGGLGALLIIFGAILDLIAAST